MLKVLETIIVNDRFELRFTVYSMFIIYEVLPPTFRPFFLIMTVQ